MEYILLTLIIALIIEVYYFGSKGGARVFSATRGKQLVFVDTSVLIDGRIVELAKTGFMPGIIAVPRSVVGELQFLADNADSEKRFRARHGLDVIQELKQIERIDFMLFQDGSTAKEGVDERLLKLAKEHSGSVCTLDFNLNKVAAVEGIAVLNINELAQTLRMAHLPGEHITIELVQKGQDSHQAVGYLPDGTMVVVENSYLFIGKPVEVEIIRSIQTAAGKMMFAKLRNGQQSDNQKSRKQSDARPSRGALVAKKVFRAKGRSVAPVQQSVEAKPEDTKNNDIPPRQQESRQKQRFQKQPQPQKAKRTSNRRPNQADKEDVLLDLVNKQ